MNEQLRANMMDKLTRELGSTVLGLLNDPGIIEIILNHDGRLWAERLGHSMEQVGVMDSWQAKTMMGTVATLMETVINSENPIIECELPLDGSRFEGMLPPIVPAPVFAIRKHLIKVLDLQDYVDQGILTARQKEVISDAIISGENILIAGGTGSGKTTLTNAVIRHISEAIPAERLVILEDTRELQCKSKNYTALKTAKGISMTKLLMYTMRLRPDRIIVGEVRDGAALAMLKAWNTGHSGGIATLHANSARAALLRLEQLIMETSPTPHRELIAEAVHVVAYIERCAGKRAVKEVVRVRGYENSRYVLEAIGE